ncbi:LOW QUALITY PROTEIN: hypothetical protein TorRG33x02_123440 [Trema orientale]|uniref:Uncharacterized protein n=1 Tax=Trema orientale TaxID=63057 RepID=A0A2P5F1S6_TREOI|nr:LOW QUALITY PROTEIN: hypothetical protein TorRG33x02_123440 [Trema orientale]
MRKRGKSHSSIHPSIHWEVVVGQVWSSFLRLPQTLHSITLTLTLTLTLSLSLTLTTISGVVVEEGGKGASVPQQLFLLHMYLTKKYAWGNSGSAEPASPSASASMVWSTSSSMSSSSSSSCCSSCCSSSLSSLSDHWASTLQRSQSQAKP